MDIATATTLFDWIRYVKGIVTDWGFFGVILLIGIVILGFYLVTECVKLSNNVTKKIIGVIFNGIKYFFAYFVLMLLVRFAEKIVMTDAHYDWAMQILDVEVMSLIANLTQHH